MMCRRSDEGQGVGAYGRARGARALAVCAGLAAALAPLPALAATSSDDGIDDYTKEQVVYVKGDAEGDVQGVYVVNRVDAGEDGTVVEDADYQGVQNLTDLRAIESGRGEVSFDAAEDEPFYYRGDLSATTDLPWDVEATYFLDGEEVDPSELEGAEGELTMVLSVKPSRAAGESATLATYVDNYLLQVSATISDDVADNLQAPDATVSTVGTDYQLTYMVMPGQDAVFTVTADVTDFEFGGWQVAGVPLALSIDVDADDAMSGDSDLDELEDGIAELSSSVSDDLVPGVEKLADGSTTYASSLKDQAAEARDAAGAVDVDAAQAAYESALQGYVGAYVQCTLNGVDPSTDEATVAAQGAMQQALTDLVTAQASVSGYQSAADALDGAAQGYTDLDAGIQGMVDKDSDESVYALRDGAQELADQTTGLQGRVADEVTAQLDDYLNPDFTMVDFVNGSSSHIENVQFVYMTESIEAPDDDDADATGSSDGASGTADGAAEDATFWDKLVALFE